MCKCLICFRIEKHKIIYYCRSNKALVLPKLELFAGELGLLLKFVYHCVLRGEKTGYVQVPAEDLNFIAHIHSSVSDFTVFQTMLFVVLQL